MFTLKQIAKCYVTLCIFFLKASCHITQQANINPQVQRSSLNLSRNSQASSHLIEEL